MQGQLECDMNRFCCFEFIRLPHVQRIFLIVCLRFQVVQIRG